MNSELDIKQTALNSHWTLLFIKLKLLRIWKSLHNLKSRVHFTF